MPEPDRRLCRAAKMLPPGPLLRQERSIYETRGEMADDVGGEPAIKEPPNVDCVGPLAYKSMQSH